MECANSSEKVVRNPPGSHNWPEQVYKQYIAALDERDKLQERVDSLEAEVLYWRDLYYSR